MSSGIFYPGSNADVGMMNSSGYNLVLATTNDWYWFQSSYQLIARFTGISIPQGATVNSAYIRLYSHDTYGNGQSMAKNIGVVQEDNASMITGWSDYSSGRSWSSVVGWGFPSTWSAPADHTVNDTTDITSLVQDIVDRSGWSSGNAMVFAMNPPGYGTGGNYLQVWMAGGYYPELHIEWTGGVTNIQVDMASAPLAETLSGAFALPVSHDFTSAPLSMSLSGNLEFQMLDYGNTPLLFQGSGYADPINAINVYFENYPFVLNLSGTVALPNAINMANAPLVLSGSIPGIFSVAGMNLVNVSLPALTAYAELAIRNGLADLDIPFPSLSAYGLSGEIGGADANLPAFHFLTTGYSNEFGSAAGLLAALKFNGKILGGVIGSGRLVFPVLNLIGSGYQIPIIVGTPNLPPLMIFSNAREDLPFSGQKTIRLYKALAFNLKNKAVTNYENFNFNSLALFNGFFLGANEDGIFILSGPDDAGTPISGSFTLPRINMGNTIPADVWLSMRNSKPLTVHIEQNEGDNPFTYSIDADPQDSIHLERVKLGRGFDKRLMQLTFANTDGGTMDIEGLMVTANQMKRSKK
jgi:hypothetical protein